VELIADAGDDQCFAFGHLAPDVAGKRHENQYRPRPIAEKSPALEQVFCAIEQGVFGDHGNLFAPLLDNVRGSDYYLVSGASPDRPDRPSCGANSRPSFGQMTSSLTSTPSA
jgi:starch phosphorylase